MTNKYIVFEDSDRTQIPIMFPMYVEHKTMANISPLLKAEAVATGCCWICINGLYKCNSEGGIPDIPSRPNLDAAILNDHFF